MILLQFSSAQGPAECCLAVAKAVATLEKEATAKGVKLAVLHSEVGNQPNTLRSAMISLQGDNATTLAKQWCGTILWICESPYRPHYPRKNWYIGCELLAEQTHIADSEIRFETMRASGAGGQHVNKTDSAIRVTHIATGISVKVQSERSQHANKRLAVLLLQAKLAEMQRALDAEQKAQRRHLHYEVERGNPIKTFKGIHFKAV
ncbi:peptide chain release factor H [Glaesserella sp.]|uniref:peptide chain release factor H n=1 Tax=Glaesserella sp. TaxID=2094731 RepID=UPI0035A083EA